MEKIGFEDFSKLDIRIGRVMSAERVKGTQKLMRLVVDLGQEKRQLVAGIAEQYGEEDLIGRQIVVVVNLQPKEIRGILSEGMLLAAVLKGRVPVLIGPDKEVPTGTSVS